MVLIPRFKEEKELKLDLKAGRQIFDKERDRKDARIAIVPRDTENPIDMRLRQLALDALNPIDLYSEFIGKNICAIVGTLKNLSFVKGKIADIYPSTRDVRFRTKKGETVIVPFDKVLYYGKREL